MSTITIAAEQLADAQGLPDDLGRITANSLDAAQRASALTRRLHHLVNALR